MKSILIISSFLFLLYSCSRNQSKITDVSEYQIYLNIDNKLPIQNAENELAFWQKKLDNAPNQYIYLLKIAGCNSQLFEITGNIDYIYKAEDALKKYNTVYKSKDVAPLRSLARNYITQHRFREAKELADQALKIGEGRLETEKLLFDVNLELGNYSDAEKSLQYIARENDFDYKIRMAKWQDHKGDLKTAMVFLEEAKLIAEKSNNTYLRTWAYSNLGDMYGHDGQIKKSYNYYLQTLKLNPNYTYSLKGIAWICFSYEKNTKQALDILNSIEMHHNTPDYALLMSEIAEYNNEVEFKLKFQKKYFTQLESKKYGAMYNKYNFIVFVEDTSNLKKAFDIAQMEVNQRPTPDSYDLLSYAYLKMGDEKKALEIQEKFVINKTHEPLPKYHLAIIYKANKLIEKAQQLKEELLEAEYELGPNYSVKIQSL